MIKLEETDLILVNIDEEDPEFYVAFLLEKGKVATFDAQSFMNDLGAIDDSEKDDELVDVEISELMHKWGVLEMFDKSEIEELSADDLIDTSALHESLYEVFITDQVA